MTAMAMSSSSPRPCSDDWNACAVPWNDVETVDGSVAFAAWLISFTAAPSEVPGLRLNDSVTEGDWPEWFTASGPTVGIIFATASSGTSSPEDERTYSIDNAAGFFMYSGSSSMITWYVLFGA